MLINISQAAESIVACQGSDCQVCSIMETVSNVYNFIVVISFSAAVLILVISGISYLLSGGKENLLVKSKNFFRNGIFGFVFVVVGWVIIHSLFQIMGFTNAASWWEFRCGENVSQESKISFDNQEFFQNFSPFYQNLKTYSNLSTFFESKAPRGFIQNSSEFSIQDQINDLKEGEVIHFLAPVRVGSSEGSQDLYLPALSVKKEGGELQLDSTGEYLDVLQNNWPSSSDLLSSDQSNILDSYFGKDRYTDNRSLINKNGQSLSNTDMQSLYAQLADMLKEYSVGGILDMNADGNEELSDIISQIGNNLNKDDSDKSKISRFISLMTEQIMKTASVIMVEKDNSLDSLSLNEWNCVQTGGEWINQECNCPKDTSLQADSSCLSLDALENNCKKSSGKWEANSNYNPTPACGNLADLSSLFNTNTNTAQRADLNQIVPERSFCQCKQNQCLDSNGSCKNKKEDSDSDGVENNLDKCPSTPQGEKNQINKSKESKYYGCSCSEVGSIKKQCPSNQCVGDYWTIYPSGNQVCDNGKFQAYSCKPLSRNFSDKCTNQNNNGNKNSNANRNQNSNLNNNYNYNYNNNFNSNTNNNSQNKNANQNDNKNDRIKDLIDKIKDDFTNGGNGSSGGGDGGSNDRMGDNNDLGPAPGGPEAVKQALKRIYERDKLRYKMIFMYTSKISNQHGLGGLTWGCGTYSASFAAPVKLLDRIIVHECTHSGDFCNGTINDIPSAEYVAVGNEIGSTKFIKEAPGQKEEIKVLQPIDSSERQEARGYGSRLIDRDIDPKGDMNPTAIGSDAGYAKGYKQSNGSWIYGWGNGEEAYKLRLNDNEHNRIKRILETMNNRKCMSSPPPDLPQLEECKGAPVLKIG